MQAVISKSISSLPQVFVVALKRFKSMPGGKFKKVCHESRLGYIREKEGLEASCLH